LLAAEGWNIRKDGIIGLTAHSFAPRSRTQLIAYPYFPEELGDLGDGSNLLSALQKRKLPGALLVQCGLEPSPLHQRIELVLRKVGINIANTGFVATATLPPREKAASLSPPP
jgi:hypothetical protein